MIISGVASQPGRVLMPPKAVVDDGGISKLQVSSSRLKSIIKDFAEISDTSTEISQAFSNLSKFSTILRKQDNALTAFAQEYINRHNLILHACGTNENYKNKQTELLDALDAEILERVSGFADDCVSLLEGMAKEVSNSDAELTHSGWVRGYDGTSNLYIRSKESEALKKDIANILGAVIERVRAGSDVIGAVKDDRSTSLITAAEFNGRSFYRKLEDFAGSMTGKLMARSNMRLNEEYERRNRPINDLRSKGDTERIDIKIFQEHWEISIVELEDTSGIEMFSGGMQRILQRFDKAASVHKQHSELEIGGGVDSNEFFNTVLDSIDLKDYTEGLKTFAQYGSRVSEYAEKFTTEQLVVLGLMYKDASVLNNDKAFEKVDAFAAAIANDNYYGFQFQDLGPAGNVRLLNKVQWFLDDETSTGLSKSVLANKLSKEEKRVLITQKYLPHMVHGKEEILASALKKLKLNSVV